MADIPLKRHNPIMVDHGDNVRVERRGRPEQEPFLHHETKVPLIHPGTNEPFTQDVLDKDGNPVYVWVVYERVHTGVEFERGHDDEPILHGTDSLPHLIGLPKVKKAGIHPAAPPVKRIVEGVNGEPDRIEMVPTETHTEYIWIIHNNELTSEAEAMELAAELAQQIAAEK